MNRLAGFARDFVWMLRSLKDENPPSASFAAAQVPQQAVGIGNHCFVPALSDFVPLEGTRCSCGSRRCVCA